MRAREVRKAFFEYFREKQHTFVAPSPVVPRNDPTLLFINAGMNQFKNIFMGEENPLFPRAVNSQLCIRVSGKHNDLEEVGADTHHLTSFEMLGNWSFGDYGKKESISWAWELLTETFKLNKKNLYATVFETDDEAFSLWQQVTDISHEHILRCGKKDNFWEMAQTGPCGPCSEIHLDRGPEACDFVGDTEGHECRVNGDCARYIELWNLVFIQFDCQKDGQLKELPHLHVDTGLGLERLAAVMQNTLSVYETDLFWPIIQKIESLSNVSYDPGPDGMPHRVLADHVRTLVMAISDHVMPSNEGRGYVLRRILRRAARYGNKMGLTGKPILYQLVPDTIDIMKAYQPDIVKRKSFVQEVIKAEETAFMDTLDSGLERFECIAKEMLEKGKAVIPGTDAFKLYDTYGFPLDLTQILATERGLEVDSDGFEKCMIVQKKRSRKDTAIQQSESSASVSKGKDTMAPVRQDGDSPDSTDTCILAEFRGAPGGGEARMPETETDRLQIARHHTVTHLLQAALRQVLGDHVNQAGSLVDTDHLRFDFSHFKTLTSEEKNKIDKLI
ncbi:MAG: alanine--tRNA ligase, partial [Candidatus Margulisbacteria bacterium]|nr:alanine--tRNA ligase [Candidatus Margulisiibacteriota bacterium]